MGITLYGMVACVLELCVAMVDLKGKHDCDVNRTAPQREPGRALENTSCCSSVFENVLSPSVTRTNTALS